MDPQVDQFIIKAKNWQLEFDALRNILLECKLEESIKWKHPCYTREGSNIVLIHGFKTYCALLFFKGALLKDPKNILVQQTENVQAARQIRFTSLQEITKQKVVIKAYVKQAIEVEKSGAKIAFKETAAFTMPEEFKNRIKTTPSLNKAFNALTPGRQKAYLLFFDRAKQSATREARIDKCLPRILKGVGLTDCICGHSKRMPNCDGSHKYC